MKRSFRVSSMILISVFLFLMADCQSILRPFFIKKALLLDTGYRALEEMTDTEPLVVIGSKVDSINHVLNLKQYKNDNEFILHVGSYFRNHLLRYDKKFPNKNNREIAQIYKNRNTENTVKNGFYFGCTDMCALTGSILVQNGYECKLIFTVSEEFSKYTNTGHTYLHIARGDKTYLYDPAMSKVLMEHYPIPTKSIQVKSIIGDQFIYLVHDFPGRLYMQSFEDEHKLRMEAFKHWKK